MSRKSFSCLIGRRWKKDDLATDSICVIKESERFNEISIEEKNSIRREDLLKYIRSKFEGLSLRNIKSFQEIILPIQEKILEIVKDKSNLGNEVKM